MTVLVYVVRFTITAGTGLVGKNIVPSGTFHLVVTVTGISTAGLNSTVQVRLGEDPANMVPIGGVTVTEVGAGTVGKNIVKVGN